MGWAEVRLSRPGCRSCRDHTDASVGLQGGRYSRRHPTSTTDQAVQGLCVSLIAGREVFRRLWGGPAAPSSSAAHKPSLGPLVCSKEVTVVDVGHDHLYHIEWGPFRSPTTLLDDLLWCRGSAAVTSAVRALSDVGEPCCGGESASVTEQALLPPFCRQ